MNCGILDSRLFLCSREGAGGDAVDIRTRLSDQSFSLLLARPFLNIFDDSSLQNI
jgi:hypothetical protein